MNAYAFVTKQYNKDKKEFFEWTEGVVAKDFETAFDLMRSRLHDKEKILSGKWLMPIRCVQTKEQQK